MKKSIAFLAITLVLASCKTSRDSSAPATTTTAVEQSITTDSVQELEFKVLDSKYITRDDVFENIAPAVIEFADNSNRIETLNKLVLEKNIPQLQEAIYKGALTHEELVLFYLHRIYKYDRNNNLSLNSIIALNPRAIDQARLVDQQLRDDKAAGKRWDFYAITGMPILLKDNINTVDLPTTAGAAVLIENQTNDAVLVENMKEAGAIILGKANLSEWAYFFCGDCPSGYSAVGGQTLNPYYRKVFDTGGSSSGSGVAVAANFAVAAVGSETSGSILSPASQNSVVGLKPTVGTIAGQGVVPISSYLDTAGPMTKNVIDAAILLNAMRGASGDVLPAEKIPALAQASLSGKRFGVFTNYLNNPLYAAAIAIIKEQNGEIVELPEKQIQLAGFLKLLNADMKQDLPRYFREEAASTYQNWDVERVMQENRKDSINSMPYGQRLFQGIVDEPAMTPQEFAAFKSNMTQKAQDYLNGYFKDHQLDGILSINNYTAGVAAVGFFPAMSIPMGYDASGEPYGLTFIAPTGKDKNIFEWAAAYERVSKKRQAPVNYQN